MQALSEWYAVCPSPSRVTSTPDSSWEASASASSSGVAGSRVVPITTIGGAPAPSTVSRSRGTSRAGGQLRQPTMLHAKDSPKVGDAFSNSGITAGTSAALNPEGSSRQLIAENASSRLVS